MSALKPIKLYGHTGTPNPVKVLMIIEELGLPYELKDVDMKTVKHEPFISLNPNGRMPAIEDPNTGVVSWESGAIIEYLIEQYDKEHKLSYAETPQRYQEASWKHFQMSGQGPYYGQSVWFQRYHPEKNLTSVIERYQNEIRRVIGVIDAHLTKTGQPYLVGEKVSFADIMWVPWHQFAVGPFLVGEGFAAEWEKTWPKAWAWHQRLAAREAVKRAYEADKHYN